MITHGVHIVEASGTKTWFACKKIK